MKMHMWIFVATTVFLFCNNSNAQISTTQFEDVSVIPDNLSNAAQHKKVSPRGMSFPLESWGSAWGDLDGDHFPDLWTGNHRKYASLYRNNRDGTFTDLLLPKKDGNPATDTDVLTGYFEPEDPTALDKTSNAADSHGAAWADVDADGDMDLLEQTGGASERDKSTNQMFINVNGKLIEHSHLAIYESLRYPELRGRSVLWLDYDNDTRLDVVLTGYSKTIDSDGNALFRNSPTNGFVKESGMGFDCPVNSNFAALADLNEDKKPELICHKRKFPQAIFDMHNLTNGKFSDITAQSFRDLNERPGNVWDAIFGDFDGDLKNEIVTVSTPGNRRGAKKVSSDTIYARLAAGSADFVKINNQRIPIENGLDFTANGLLKIVLTSGHLSGVYLGANAVPQALTTGLIEWNALLDPADVVNQGIPATFDKVGLYLGYVDDPQIVGDEHWSMRIKHGGPDTGVTESLWAVLQSITSGGTAAQIGSITLVNFEIEKFPLGFLKKNNSGQFVNRSENVDLDNPVSCVSITAGDFDNDMDLDIYLVCEQTPANVENILYENLGDIDADGFTNFAAVANAAGAAGTLAGDGKAVAMADYDVDGFLDLFVTNGHSGGSIPNGPDQLFHNRGNDNNWIELDLIGTASNPHGIGARIEATANGVTQLREMNGGAHNFIQDHQRIHFGLAKQARVRLKITWPSGIVDIHNAVPANRLYRAIENGNLEAVDLPTAGPYIVNQDECGIPYHDSSVNHGLFLWKSCAGDGKWRLRASAGGITQNTAFMGNIYTDQVVTELTAINLEPEDVVQNKVPARIDFILNVKNTHQDGFNTKFDVNTKQACLDIAGRDHKQVLLGAHQKSVTMPIDLITLATCQPPARTECSSPTFPPGSHRRGIFIWKNCLTGQWSIMAEPGLSDEFLRYKGLVSSDLGLSDIQSVGLEFNDSLDIVNAQRIDFSMKVKDDDRDVIKFNDNGGEACIDIPELPDGTTVRLGAEMFPVGLPMSTQTFQDCTP